MDSLEKMCGRVHGKYNDDGEWEVDHVKVGLAMDQYQTYKRRAGSFAKEAARLAARTIPGHRWWVTWGRSTPELTAVATWVLSQVVASSSCERVNSDCGYIKDKCANRMLPSNLDRMVRIHHNLRFMDRVHDFDYGETNIMWDVDFIDNEDSDSEVDDDGV